MNTPLHDQLRLLGLNHSEIAVYLYLLENGLSSPPNVSRGTNIARTNCYNLLESLREKGLIEEHLEKKHKVYLASDPEALVRSLEKKKEAIQQILPDLRGLYSTQKNKPKIRFYDGTEQIKEIYLESLSAQKILAIGSNKRIEALLPGFLNQYYATIKERGIIFYDLTTSNSRSQAEQNKTMLRGLYEAKIIPREYKDPPTDILVWDNNIALLTLVEPIFGTILTNSLLAETFGLIFNLVWKNLDSKSELPV